MSLQSASWLGVLGDRRSSEQEPLGGEGGGSCSHSQFAEASCLERRLCILLAVFSSLVLFSNYCWEQQCFKIYSVPIVYLVLEWNPEMPHSCLLIGFILLYGIRV